MATSSERSYQFESFTLNASEGVLLYHGRRVPLAPKTFRTLLALVEKAGHIVTKEDLSKRIWGDTVVGEENLTFHISALRKIFAHFEQRQEFIHTEHRIGYRFVPPVRVVESGSPEGENAGASANGVSPEAESGGEGVVGGRARAGWKTNNFRFFGPNSGPQNDSRGEMEPRTGAMGKEGVEGRGRWRRWAKWLALLAGLPAVTAGAAWLAVPRPHPTALRWQQITADGRNKRGEVATDGERLYFIEQFPTGWAVAQVSAQGGEAVPLAAVPKESSVTSIGPDHRELLVVEDRDVKPGSVEILPLFGGEPRRLGNVRAYSAQWSPDGARMAYTTDGGVYVGGADGSNPLQIVSLSGQLIRLHWSPDSRKVCFVRSEVAGGSLWEVNRDGTGLVCLFPGLLSKLRSNSGIWTPDGKYLIAQGVCEGTWMPTAVRLSSMPFNWFSAAPTCLGLGPEHMAATTISPDGRRLFGLGGTATRPLLEEYDARTRWFRPFRGGFAAQYADFSRDGQRVAWVAGANDLTDARSLFVSGIDDSHKVQLTKPPLRAELPRWSPDGKWIAFMGQEEGQKWRARVVSAQGGGYEPVSPQDNQEGAPSWSPDGTRIAFGGMVQPSIRTTGRIVIHILNLKTGQMSEVPGSEGLWTARWSPDGRYLAAMTADVHNLMLFDFHTARWTKLAGMATILEITWARREEALYFNAEPTPGERGLFRVKIPDGALERIADLKGSSDSDWFGLAPDDTPLVVRNTTPKEVYGITVKWP